MFFTTGILGAIRGNFYLSKWEFTVALLLTGKSVTYIVKKGKYSWLLLACHAYGVQSPPYLGLVYVQNGIGEWSVIG